MNGQTVMVVYTIIAMSAVFLLREKYPNRPLLGCALCVFAPAWGQIYIKSKWNFMAFMFLMSLERGLAKADSGYLPWLIVAVISVVVFMIRWVFHDQGSGTGSSVTYSDPDREYVRDLNDKLKKAGVETERDLI